MTEGNDDLPEIAVEALLDEDKREGEGSGLPDIDVDLSDDTPVRTDTPPLSVGVAPGAAIPAAPALAASELDLDIAVDEPVPAGPLPPSAAVKAGSAAKPPPGPAQSSSRLDLDALLADLDLDSALKPTRSAVAAAPPIQSPAPLPTPANKPAVRREVSFGLDLLPTAPAPAAASDPMAPPAAATRSVDLDAVDVAIDIEAPSPAAAGGQPALVPDLDVPDAPAAPVERRAEPPSPVEAHLELTLEGMEGSDKGPDLASSAAAVIRDVAEELGVAGPAPATPGGEAVGVVSTEVSAALDLAVDAAPPTLPPVEGDEGPEPAPVAEVGAAPPSDSLPEAPALPLSAEEPPPVPAPGLEELNITPESLAALRRLAGAGADPQARREALHAALKGEPFDPKALPDARSIALGVARVLAATGFSVNEMIDAILELNEE